MVLRKFLLVNIILIFFYHGGVIFASIMQMGNMTSNEEILSNLYWMVPQSFILASIPNVIMYFYFHLKEKPTNLFRNFLIAELFVVLIYVLLHGGLVWFLLHRG